MQSHLKEYFSNATIKGRKNEITASLTGPNGVKANVKAAWQVNRLTQLVRGYVNAADLRKTGSCQLFRHSCAMLMLEDGADIRFVQRPREARHDPDFHPAAQAGSHPPTSRENGARGGR